MQSNTLTTFANSAEMTLLLTLCSMFILLLEHYGEVYSADNSSMRRTKKLQYKDSRKQINKNYM